MAAGGVRNLEDLIRLEAREIDARDARRVVAVDEEPAAVGYAIAMDEVRDTTAVLLWPARMTWVGPDR